MTNPVLQFLITARDEASEIIGRVGAGMRGIGQAVSEALTPLRTFQGLIGAAIGVGGLNELKDRADAYTRLTNSLRVATTSEEDYQTALQTVTRIAQATFSDLETTASLYARISSNAQAMGLSQQQVANLTELISKGMQLGGASAAEYASATLQLTQAFGSGVLRGEEFNAVMESSPELMRQLASGLGVAIGELRGLAEQGRLTASTVATALLAQKDAIDTAYAETVQTVDQALTNLSSRVTLFIGQMGESSGASSAAANSLNFLANNIDVVAAALGAGLTAAIGKAAVSMGAYIQASLAARQAAQDQAIAAAAQERAAIASAQANVAAAQAALNRAIQEQNLAREITRLLTAELGVSASEADIAAARARSATAAQAATAATQRLSAAQTQLAGLQAGAAASTGLFARALGVLTGPVGLIILAVTAFAGLFGAMSKQQTATDALAQSTDDYANALHKATDAQLEASRLELEQQLREQQAEVDKLVAGVQQQAAWYNQVARAGGNVASVTDELNRRQADLDTATQKTNALQERLNTILKEREQRQSTISTGTQQQTALYAQQALKMDGVVSALTSLAKQQKAVADADEQRLQTLIDLAKSAGDYQRAEELSLQLAQRRAQTAQEQANTDHAAAVAAQAKVTALENEYRSYTQLTPKQQEALQQAREDAELKRIQASASQANAEAKRKEADSVDLLTIAEQKNVTTAKSYADATESLVAAQLDGLRAEIDLAKAKGFTATAQRLSRELAVKEAEGALRVAQAKQKEQEMEYALAVAKRNQVAALVAKNQATKEDLELAELTVQKELAEAQAAGVNTQAQEILAQKLREVNAAKTGATKPTQESTEALQDNTKAAEENAEASEKAGKSYTLLENAAVGALRELSGLSAGMNDLVSMLLRVDDVGQYFGHQFRDELGKLQLQLQTTNQVIEHNLHTISQYDAYSKQVYAANTARKMFLEQAIAATELAGSLTDLTESARLNKNALEDMVRTAEQNIQAMDLLDEVNLKRLQSAIDAANDKLREMQDETQSARDRLTELNAQLLEEQGANDKAALLRQQLNYQQQLAKIEVQRQEAELTGNRELLTILAQQEALLSKINQTRVNNIQAEAEANRAEQTTTTRTPSSTSAGSSASAGSSRTYNLNLVGVGGQTISATTPQDPSTFLDTLEAAQRRSL